DAAAPFFETLEALQSLYSHLSPAQKNLLRQSQAVRQSLVVHGPFINSILEVSEKVHHAAASLDDQSFLVKEVKMLPTSQLLIERRAPCGVGSLNWRVNWFTEEEKKGA
ncbi:hypothetical protein A2U01_0061042, partial [Trifolium medium]|nr:hypothetical protein [Trifolium medium]